MATFEYTAYDSSGSKVESQVESDDILSAKKMLISQKLHVIKINLKPMESKYSIALFEPKVSLSDLEFLTSELSILLNSGVKIDKGLKILNRNHTSQAVDSLVSDILKNLKQGKSVSDSFKTSKEVFDPLYINLIAIGEATGRLPDVFSGLANDLKFKKDLKSKITQALTYPCIIFFVCIACILFVFNYIVPQMGSIFSDASELPIYTSLLLASSEWMQNYQLWVLACLIAIGAGFYANRDNKTLRQRVASRLLKMPVFSSAIKQVETIRFNSAMSLMLDAGIKVDVAIEHANKNVRNQVIQKSLKIAKDKIKKGASVSASLAQTPIFPSFYVSLLEVGEESGNLAKIFSEISIRSKNDFDSWTTRITSLLEPMLILVMGGIVGSVVVTMLLSVVSVNDIAL